jgi:hypothetical protein
MVKKAERAPPSWGVGDRIFLAPEDIIFDPITNIIIDNKTKYRLFLYLDKETNESPLMFTLKSIEEGITIKEYKWSRKQTIEKVANIFQLILETIGDIKEEDENDADIFKEALKMAIKKYDGSFDYFW